MDGLPNTGNAFEDAKELGKALMRGSRRDLKLGYSYDNAVLTCADQYDLTDEGRERLSYYLRGFGVGLKIDSERARKAGNAFNEGVSDGIGEARHGDPYPA